jgi:hypothetical protein
VPGTIATAILVQEFHVWAGQLFGITLKALSAKGAAFLVCSYFIGHLIFLFGSLIDDIHEPLRKYLYDRREKSSFPYAKGASSILKLEPNEQSFKIIKSIRLRYATGAEHKAANPFQWAKAVLLCIAPDALEEVHRLEADSKFFRSMIVVCLLAAVIFLCDCDIAGNTAALLLSVLCFVRYFERRVKAVTQACIHVITLHQLGKLPKPNHSCQPEALVSVSGPQTP